MPSLAQRALFLLLICAAAWPTQAQQVHASNSHRNSRSTANQTPADQGLNSQLQLRPITLDDGLAILSAALDSRHYKAFSTDCSHFVHGLYERAGFPYAYAPSVDLYAGLDQFERVFNPQPGDLIVWLGHAGIVINPAQHSFFSLLHSGATVATYDSSYWKKKGHPRFFRYIKAVSADDFSGSSWTASR
jgi:cell wall-associated NlpC family hydrolase